MRLPFLPAASAILAVVVSTQPDPLRVVRSGPGSIAAPNDTIVVSFDRPVAGSYDNIADPNTIISVSPAIKGRYEWRDPVTIRVIPDMPLERGATYSVSVDPEFTAMDGSSLASSYEFSFRVRGPSLLSGMALNDTDTLKNTSHRPQFTLVFDTPVPASAISMAASIVTESSCKDSSGKNIDRISLKSINSSESSDTVRLESSEQLPPDCLASLRAPRELTNDFGVYNSSQYTAWKFKTHGEFRIASARCATSTWCPNGPVILEFSTPVKGSDLAAALSIAPRANIDLDTTAVSNLWRLGTNLSPRKTYALILDKKLKDTFGQTISGNPSIGFRTTGYAPDIQIPEGRLTIERTGFRTLVVRSLNIDTLYVERLAIPDSAIATLLGGGEWTWREYWLAEQRNIRAERIPVPSSPDVGRIIGVSVSNSTDSNSQNALHLIRVRDAVLTKDKKAEEEDSWFRLALVQVTDLGVHAKIGDNSGSVWVTSGIDGSAVKDAKVQLHDHRGNVLASGISDETGMTSLSEFKWKTPSSENESVEEGYVSVSRNGDIALLPVRHSDPDLAPWRFGLSSAWGTDRATIAAAVFTDRDLYRPGEEVHAKAVVRGGMLGSLEIPGPRDTVRWIRRDQDYKVIDSLSTILSEYGSADTLFSVSNDAATGTYNISLEWKHRGSWSSIGNTFYRIAEYRPPEFLVDLTTVRAPQEPGDSIGVHVSSNYLFGAPMGGAEVRWSLMRNPIEASSLSIAGVGDWTIGNNDYGWNDTDNYTGTEFISSGMDSLDANGKLDLVLGTSMGKAGQPMRFELSVNVSDVNRQMVGSRISNIVHPAEFYIAAKVDGDEWFWKSGETRSISIKNVRVDGSYVSGNSIKGVLIRREWHRIERIRNGYSESVGEWVADTVGTCSITASIQDVKCNFTPTKGGVHSVILTSNDNRGRETVTSFTRWVVGPEWVPWNDENKLKLDVVADKNRYAPGDTATIMFASPFTDAEAWITVEREGIIDQQRLRLTSGTTVFRLPITEAHAPNVFISMFVARGRSEAPGTLGDPGRPTVRVGFTELRVTPELKRLSVDITPNKREYRPGDSAAFRIAVSDPAGKPQQAELTLWAVDEGVLAMTGFRTPDPLDLLYRPRGIGMTLASTHANVAPQLPQGAKAVRESGGGGGSAEDGVLRSTFRTTAFFLGSVVTDPTGIVNTKAQLPDNLTTFRVMAVAASKNDRYGSGDTSLIVTRPLVARPSLPRFVRKGDVVDAGVAINRREGNAGSARIEAKIEGAKIEGNKKKTVSLETGKGVEVRFPFKVTDTDKVTFRYDASSGNDKDAVQVSIPIKPDSRPVVASISSMIDSSAVLALPLTENIDTKRSTISISVGSSPLALVAASLGSAMLYPWSCTEQIASTALPFIALIESGIAPDGSREQVERMVKTIQQRQRYDGGIGYWNSSDWTTPWITAHAAIVLIEARNAGIAVDSTVLERVGYYLSNAIGEPESEYSPSRGRSPVSRNYSSRAVVLGEYLAAAEAIRVLGQANESVENDLLRQSSQLSIADRSRLARIFALRGEIPSALSLLSPIWSKVVSDGRRGSVVDTLSNDDFYFATPLRATSELLRATIAVAPNNPLMVQLLEYTVHNARGGNGWFGVPPDMASAVMALRSVHKLQNEAIDSDIVIKSANRTLINRTSGLAARDTTVSIERLVRKGRLNERDSIKLEFNRATNTSLGLYASATLTAHLSETPSRPLEKGITVERWTEDAESGQAIVEAQAGSLVRVFVRISVPAQRRFVAVEDPLPAGLEPVDLSMRTSVITNGGSKVLDTPVGTRDASWWSNDEDPLGAWSIGRWDSGYWTPFEQRELKDDRVTWSASVLFPGRYTLSYLARAVSAGNFVRPPAHAEEMYDPSVFGRTEGSVFRIRAN